MPVILPYFLPAARVTNVTPSKVLEEVPVWKQSREGGDTSRSACC